MRALMPMRVVLPDDAGRSGSAAAAAAARVRTHDAIVAPMHEAGWEVRLLKALTDARHDIVFAAAEDARTADGWPVVLVDSEEWSAANPAARIARVDALVLVEGWLLVVQLRVDAPPDDLGLLAFARQLVERATVELPSATNLADVWHGLTLRVDEMVT